MACGTSLKLAIAMALFAVACQEAEQAFQDFRRQQQEIYEISYCPMEVPSARYFLSLPPPPLLLPDFGPPLIRCLPHAGHMDYG